MRHRWIAMVVFAVVLSGTSARADVPKIISDVTIDVGELGSFELFEDFDPAAKTLYVKPRNLKIASGPDGKPKLSIVLIEDIVDNKIGAANNTAWGYYAVTLHVGYNNRDAVFDAVRKKLDVQYPQYKTWKLTNLSLRPGTGEVGVRVVAPPGEGKPAATGVVWMPYGVSTTIGAEVTVTVPITKEHADIIRQQLLQGNAGSGRLGLEVHYRANSTFAVKPCTIRVTANQERAYSYFHEKFGVGGGFWIFSWNHQRETIREDFKKSGDLKSELVFPDPENQSLVDKYVKVAEILKKYEDDAVSFLADIEVDRSGKVPDGGYEKRTGRTTIFSPHFFWTFTAWAGGYSGSVDIKRNASGTYKREFNLTAAVEKPITMQQEDVAVDRSVFKLVNLNKAAYIVDTFTVRPFQVDGEEINLFPRWVKTANVTVRMPDGGDSLTFAFNKERPDTRTSPFFRDAVASLDENKNLRLSLPDLEVSAILNVQGAEYKTPLRKFRRTSDRFTTNEITLSDFFELIKIDGELYFDVTENNKNFLMVQVIKNNSPVREFLLKPKDPAGYVLFDKSAGLDGAQVKVKLVDGIKEHPYGSPRPLVAGAEVFVINKSDVGIISH